MAGMISMHIEQFLEDAFLKILNMSMTAAYIIIAIVIARFFLKKAPKKYSYALWAAALFRLVCPVSFKSVFSLLALKPFAMPVEETASALPATQIVHIPEDIGFMAQPEIHTGLEAVNAVVNPVLPAPTTELASVNPIQIWTILGAYVWAIGIFVLLAVSIVSLIKLRRSLGTATKLGEDVWQSEAVRSPFIIGLFRPKIYIPYGLTEPRLGYVLAHERAHIRRLDHVVRTLAYLVLCLHWFNPLVWLAFHLMGRDMELSCDEKVLGRMGDKAEYSETLLSFATRRRFPAPTPLAFGESSVSQRIKNALKWHRPKVWVSAVALLLCVAVIVSCAANPKDDESGPPVLWGEWVPRECVYLTPVMSWFPFGGDNGLIYSIREDGVRVNSHESGDFLYSYGAVWGWQGFPYTDEEWQEMFLLYENTFAAPISSLYDEVLYQPLMGNRTDRVFVEGESEVDAFLLLCDGELWFVSTNKDSKGQKWISSIYALQKQEELGMASFAYPDGTSNEPGIEISFADRFESVKVTTDGGCVSAYVNGSAVGGADSSTVVPEDGKLFWCPVQNDRERPEAYNLSQSAVMRLTVDYGDATAMCSIYVSYDDGIYTLRPVGKAVEMFQTGEKTAELDLDYRYAKANVSPTDIPAGSPWALFAGLDVGSVNSIMIDGDPSAVLNAPELEVLKVQVVEALLRVAQDEVYIGRGGPWQWTLSFGINDGESAVKLGYCGDVVEVQLDGAAKEAYPADRGTWVIRNAALTELLQSLTRSAVTEFEFSLSPDRYADSGLALRLDIPDTDKIEITSYARSFSENGTVLESSASEALWGDFDVILRPALDSDGNNAPDLLAESGGIVFTVWKDGKYAQGQLVCEGTNLRPTPDSMGKTADYKVYLEGPFEAAVDSESGLITVSFDEGWLKPTPQAYLSSLLPSDVTGFELNGKMDSRVLGAGQRDKQLVDLLSGVKVEEMVLRQGGILAHSCEAVLETDYTSIVLRYGSGQVELSFPDGKFDAAGVWYIENEELCAFFESILAKAAEEFDILSHDAEDVKSIYLQTPAWQSSGARVMLDEATAERLLELLESGKKTVMAYPSHEASMQASIWYTLTVTYEDGYGDVNGDLLYMPTEGDLYRFTGTYGSGGDPGYVRAESRELEELLKSFAGIIDKDELPGVTISFTNFSDTEVTMLGIEFASGEGVNPSAHSSISRGDYTSSVDIKPMEKGVEYVSTYSAKSLGAVAGFETVYISFDLDGEEKGTYAFPREKIWGGTVECSLSENGEFSAEPMDVEMAR